MLTRPDDALRLEIAAAIMQSHFPAKDGTPPRKWSACSVDAQALFLRHADAAYAIMRREYDATLEVCRRASNWPRCDVIGCDASAHWFYPTDGGRMLLCTAHNEKHKNYTTALDAAAGC